MAISYPLALPTSIGIANITLSANNAVAISQSPFTFQQQIIQHPGQRWTASVSIPPVRRDLAEPWNAFLLALNGPVGTFLLGDPNAKAPRGSALGFRRNLLRYSEQFDNAGWNKSETTVNSNTTAAPDGLSTADLVVANTATSSHIVNQTISGVVSGQVYTASIYAKPAGYDWLRLSVSVNFASTYLFVNLSTDDFGFASGNIQNPAVSDAGNGWKRISFSVVATGTGNTNFTPYIVEDNSFTAFSGDGTSGLYLWGAQLEEGNLSDYQPIADDYGPYVNGAGQTGNSLVIDAGSPSETGYLLAGDYIQLGSGATATLHKVLQDVDTNEAGQATLDIWPNVRTSPADNALVTLANTVGRFRLSGNQQSFSINEASIYGISFDCVEVL